MPRLDKMSDGTPIINQYTPHSVVFDPAHARGAIPRDYSVQPETMFLPPSQIPNVPQSEWEARWQEQEDQKSSIEHVYLQAGWDCFDQNGQGYCVTDDTEVLTERGWVAYPDYNWSDPLATVNPLTHQMEFQQPFEKHVYEYDGPMMYSTNRRLDFGVTPDHQLYVRKWDERKRRLSDSYSFVRAADMGWYAGFMPAPRAQIGTELIELEVPGDRRYDGDDFFAVLGLIVSDGYAGGTDKTRNWVSFASFRPESRPAVAALAARTGFRESPGRPGVFVRYDAAALAAWVRANCYAHPSLGARNKRVPDLVRVASARQVRHFLTWFDDRNRDGSQYFTTSKPLVDGLQELFMRVGKRSHIGSRPARVSKFDGVPAGEIKGGPSFVLTVGEVDSLSIDRKRHIEVERYKGLVYCAAVPNHTLLTRRNGSVLISSNCWAYSVGHTVMLNRARDHQPYVRLNPHGVASIIRNGMDFGGWCGLSAEFYRDVGCPEEGTGPGQWPYHEYRNPSKYDTPQMRQLAGKYRITDDFVDLTQHIYDRNLTFQQVASCLFNNYPCAVDFNWWSHSVCAVRIVKIEAGRFGLLILNSWTPAWGRKGLAVLDGNSMIPDGAVCTAGVMATGPQPGP